MGVTCVLVLGAILVSCAGGSDDQPATSASVEASQASPTEEEPSACLGKEKGQQIEIVMGAPSADSPKKYVYTPETLHPQAGRFVTIKLTNPSLNRTRSRSIASTATPVWYLPEEA